MKNIAFKIEEKELDKLNHFKDLEKATIADFMMDAVNLKIETMKKVRSGGIILTIPNPEMSGAPHITSDQKLKALQILHQANADLAKEAGFVGSGLSEYAEWLQYHFFEKSEQQQKRFEQAFYEDIEADQ